MKMPTGAISHITWEVNLSRNFGATGYIDSILFTSTLFACSFNHHCSTTAIHSRDRDISNTYRSEEATKAHHISYNSQFSAMLLSLPNELILEVVANLTHTTDVFYLLMTSKDLSIVVEPILVEAGNRIIDSAAASQLPLLHFAALHNDRTAAKLALRNDPTCINNFLSGEGTPLHIAVFNGLESMVEFLLTQGADPNVVEPDPPNGIPADTPLQTALSGVIQIQNGFIIETVPILSEGVVRRLLISGANPNTLTHDGMNALLQAAHLGLPAIVHAILDTDMIDINSRDATGGTALHVAVARAAGGGSFKVAELLLARGIDVNAIDTQGQTALFHAITEKVTALLLAYGAVVGIVDTANRTVLHHLAECFYIHNPAIIVKQILTADGPIDVSLVDVNQKTALDYATETGNDQVLAVLREFGQL